MTQLQSEWSPLPRSTSRVREQDGSGLDFKARGLNTKRDFTPTLKGDSESPRDVSAFCICSKAVYHLRVSTLMLDVYFWDFWDPIGASELSTAPVTPHSSEGSGQDEVRRPAVPLPHQWGWSVGSSLQQWPDLLPLSYWDKKSPADAVALDTVRRTDGI